jgi:hypothetical protein
MTDIQNLLKVNKIFGLGCTKYIKQNGLILFNVYEINISYIDHLYYPIDHKAFNSFFIKKILKKDDHVFNNFCNGKLGDILISNSTQLRKWNKNRRQGWIITKDDIISLKFYKHYYILPWQFLQSININNLHRYHGKYIEHHSLYTNDVKFPKILVNDMVIYTI